MDRSIRNTVTVLVLAVVLIFGFVVARQLMLDEKSADSQPAPDLAELNTFVYEQGRELAPFTLFNENGESVTEADLRGGWTFAFLGYTYCPDVCPATLALLRRMDKLLPPELPEPDYLLISADPERDTPERMKEYLGFYGDGFHGLTGDEDTLHELAKSLNGVFIHRGEVDGQVLVDHSAHLALIDPDGRMIAVIQPPLDPEKLARAFRRIYEWARAQHPRAG